MNFDVFISYAWTDDRHREWVRLLAAGMRHLGFNVGIDAEVDYGNDLDGFMRKIPEARHVLMVADDNYVHRADNLPDSGVGMENKAIRDAINSHPESWLAPLLVRNDEGRLPEWLSGRNPKYFDFRTDHNTMSFPGAEQIDDLWRWLVGLSPDKEYAVSAATLRERAYRIEKIDELRAPGAWSHPELLGEGIEFPYQDAPKKTIILGAGSCCFSLTVSGRGADSIYVYADYVKAVGLVKDDVLFDGVDGGHAYKYITPGRSITPRIGQSFVLMNDSGVLCIVRLCDVKCERNNGAYEKPRIVFNYKILHEE